jgi:hypothetical protein
MNELNLVEFLRFGSSSPGNYWGCCAGDIIQCFKSMPDAKASIQLVNGDGGYPQTNSKGEHLFAGPTNKDVFLQRLRVGTFGSGDMPNHFFFLVLEEQQMNSAIGKAWLPILKECGFEFIRKVNNSVWNKNNYIFGLIRNCGTNAVSDQFTPPKVWTDLPSNGKTELWELIAAHGTDQSPKSLTAQYKEVDKAVWDKIGTAKFLTEAEVVAAGAPVIYAGLRSENPQELKATRDARNAEKGKEVQTSLRSGSVKI